MRENVQLNVLVHSAVKWNEQTENIISGAIFLDTCNT